MEFSSPNLNLAYLAPAQAQKHITHNEALRQLDALVQLSALSISNAAKEESVNGDRQIVGLSPVGIFEGHENDIAAYQDGVWAFYKPRTGWQCYIASLAQMYIYKADAWIKNQGEEVSKLGINAGADDINRLSLKGEATLLSHDGAGHQLKINKSGASDTASLLFQTNYASKAEIGLTGEDNIHLKVSEDGNSFKDGLIINSKGGHVSCPNGIQLEQMGSSVEDSGGEGYHYGIPSVFVKYFSRQTLNMVQGRVYFCPVYIDRPTKIMGGFISQFGASSTPGSVLRVGVYDLGQASANSWELGARISDLGTCPADDVGHKDFSMTTPSVLGAGWYAFAVGTNGAGAMVRNVRSMQSGQSFLIKWGSGTGSDLRFAGATSHLYANNANADIETGFAETWPGLLIDLPTVQPYGFLPFIPKWEAWQT